MTNILCVHLFHTFFKHTRRWEGGDVGRRGLRDLDPKYRRHRKMASL